MILIKDWTWLRVLHLFVGQKIGEVVGRLDLQFVKGKRPRRWDITWINFYDTSA
jgi:hypothetical protein